MFNADYFISKLKLESHIEGGFFKEIYKNPYTVSNLPVKFEGERQLSSTIYYLLRSGEVSKFHKLKFDEIWFYHYGSPVIIHTIDQLGVLKSHKLGLNLDQGETPQVIIPSDTVFGAEILNENSFSLVSCMVSPGFNYIDFELFTGKDLCSLYPQHSTLIKKLNG